MLNSFHKDNMNENIMFRVGRVHRIHYLKAEVTVMAPYGRQVAPKDKMSRRRPVGTLTWIVVEPVI